ncbi:hypothetical protein GQ602_003349 [Ophiocordyceps camponoti-floridani]|uniref:Uncharacterized protein n=1 Tax=Ophiocordyceps camponoti-floridani TaxID=2030778 RepID=A0A8H4Q805_9HYPO|nr:hypothetical protein GQ602_003349 [Ophiocordyceps camponoti-floridani]
MRSVTPLLTLLTLPLATSTTATLHRRGSDDITLSEEGYTTVAPTAPWVTINDEGQPAMTVTPSMATVSGTSTLDHAAPHDLTASVYTWVTWGAVTTSTGAPPNPTAVDKKTGQGAFSRCYRDGKGDDFAPFCRPLVNSSLLTGTTYYVTWDPDYYKPLATGNTTVEIAIRLDYLNQSTDTWTKLDTYDRVPARWGFWPLRLTDAHLKSQRYNNATITLLAYSRGADDERNHTAALPVTFTTLGVDDMAPPPVPRGATLLVALPVALGCFFLVLAGLFFWHRQTRRINLGNVMGRSRHGYTGRRERGGGF